LGHGFVKSINFLDIAGRGFGGRLPEEDAGFSPAGSETWNRARPKRPIFASDCNCGNKGSTANVSERNWSRPQFLARNRPMISHLPERETKKRRQIETSDPLR
jgi:hypothetical protein